MSYRLIAEEKPHHPVSRLARVLGVSRAGFYAWQKRPPSQRAKSDAALTERIKSIHEETDGIYGAPRIHAELAGEHGVRVGRKRVARLMRAAGLEGVSRRRRYRVGTTTPGGEAPAAPDVPPALKLHPPQVGLGPTLTTEELAVLLGPEESGDN